MRLQHLPDQKKTIRFYPPGLAGLRQLTPHTPKVCMDVLTRLTSRKPKKPPKPREAVPTAKGLNDASHPRPAPKKRKTLPPRSIHGLAQAFYWFILVVGAPSAT